MSRRVAFSSLALLVVTACSGGTVTSSPDLRSESISATAYSKVDGVETWDLTGPPSDEAFGITADSSAAIYETDEPRQVRIMLQGRTIEIEARLVDFYHGGTGSGYYSFRVSSPQLKAASVEQVFRSTLRQLGLDEVLADRYAQQVAAAPSDQSEVIGVGIGSNGKAATFGPLTVAPSATFTPLAGLGRVVFGASWPTS